MSNTLSPTQLKTKFLTKAEYAALRDALEHYYGNKLGLSETINIDGPWTDTSGIFKWSNRNEFNEKIFEVLRVNLDLGVSGKDINKAYLDLTKLEIEAPKTAEFKESEASPVSNTLANEEIRDKTSIDLDQKQQELKKRQAEESNRLVREAIERKQKIQEEINRRNAENQIKDNQPEEIDRRTSKEHTLEQEFFKKTEKQVVVAEEKTAPQISPSDTSSETENTGYIDNTQYKTDQELVNNAKVVRDTKEAILQKQKEYVNEISKANSIKTVLEENKTPTKVWVKVDVPEETKPQIKILREQAQANPKEFINTVSGVIQQSPSLKALPNNEAKIIADEAAYNMYESTITTTSPLIPIAISHEVIQKPGVLENITSDVNQQATIKHADVEISNSRLGQYEMWRRISQQNDIKVDVSLTPQPGYTEMNANELINNETITPYINSYESQNDTIQSLEDLGKDQIRSTIVNKVGQSVTSKLSQLPEGSLSSQIYNNQLVQATLADAGFAPSTWTAADGNLVGNFFMSTKHGNLAGSIQKMTGFDLGMVEVSTAGYALAGGFSYYSTATIAIEYSGGMFAAEAFAGGAGVAMSSGTIGTVALGAGAESLAGAATFSAPTIMGAGTFGAEAFMGGASVAAATEAGTLAAAGTAGAVTTAGVGVGATVGGTAVAASQVVPGVGLVVAGLAATWALVKKAFKKIPWHKIKKFLDDNNLSLLFGGGLLAFLLPLPLALVGGGAALAGLFSIASVGSGGIGGGFVNFMGLLASIGKFFIAAIGIPTAIFLIFFASIMTFILIVINNSAYVVPQGVDLNSPGVTQNPYIGITKVANPAGPFENSKLPLTITYTVTITAKQQSLTNVVISDECTSINSNGSMSCPSTAEQPPSGTISAGASFTYNYTETYNQAFKDSLVNNSVTVTASVVSQTAQQTATGGTSIIIGQPPTGCFEFDSSWSTADKNRETIAINKVIKATTYMAALCQGNRKITLHRIGSGSGCGGGGGEVTGDIINIYNAGVNCSDFVTYYTLAHETGHVYANRTGKYQQFASSNAMTEGLICTYPNALTPSEDFAEMIALYYTKVAGSTKARCMSGNLKTAYPLHWQFAHDNIFYANLDW